jgi:hypothetical protein
MHLVHIAKDLGVCIHVLRYEAMGKEIMRYGDAKGTQHLCRSAIITRSTRSIVCLH